jgi:hypothetical protein
MTRHNSCRCRYTILIAFYQLLLTKERKMKKAGYILLLGVLLTFLGVSAWANTVDKLSLADSILNLNGTYLDVWAGEYNAVYDMWGGEIFRI